ncbi:MAG TPA: LTA synthase family protein [Hyphomicrobiaceae bacterium]|jgi:phosphoglycerol transferase MdoB-like AlkP superfamily enzyme|nr:LTA synthase family protein [Hyphomicrobiaceae bacterium]
MDGRAVGASRSAGAALAARLLPFAIIFLISQFGVRLTLALRVMGDAADDPLGFVASFLLGTWFDLVVFSVLAVPVVIWWLAAPQNLKGGRLDRYATLAGATLFLVFCLIAAVGEHLFWSEFGTRFNFIAIDYLIYTHEVVQNIWQSYPIAKLVAALLAVASAGIYFGRQWLVPKADGAPIAARWIPALAALLAPVVAVSATPTSLAFSRSNAYANELSLNGIWALAHAFFNNEIDYRRFYKTLAQAAVAKRIESLLAEKDALLASPGRDPLTRLIRREGGMLRKNVMLISMESMGAEYMAHFGNSQNITPNLDRLASEGLLFTKLLATGTRTVRGLEALTLSMPPTPGQSILRRPHNAGLFTIGDVFRDRGYDTRFLYGGYGYFDNMNAFYAGNGFEVIDRTSLSADEIHFENVWGVADEDLFQRVIKEADRSFASGRPFFQLVMTTSNHRPFTYPNGVIDIFSKTGRLGGVKYADHAIGSFVEAARRKPWFRDTLFVFVADHTAGTGGKIELDPTRYHIPLIFYAPSFIAPSTHAGLASQIDVAPVLLGLLNTSYVSRFYGRDVLHDKEAQPRAFISTYEKVALVRGDTTLMLAPRQTVGAYVGLSRRKRANADPELEADAIAYFQAASAWAQNSRRLDTRLHLD